MNKRFDIHTKPILSGIIDQIEATLMCPRFREYNNLIYIDTWENIKWQMPRNKEVAENGFGFCIPDFSELGLFKRLIVINTYNCLKVDFTVREIAAIICHELGHLLNGPELAKVPTILDFFENGIDYSEAKTEEVRRNNDIKMEIFADSYANQYGYGKELISTFYRQNQFFDQKIRYFEERVESIKNKEILIGSVAPIETNGW